MGLGRPGAVTRQENHPMRDDRQKPRRTAALGVILAMFCLSWSVLAEEPAPITVTLKDHRFDPAEIHLPTGKPAALHVINLDDTAEEFDSSALQVEKVIAAGHYATIRLRPLAPGRYPFMGEFHPDSAKGVVVSE
jgi:Cupredoxin-like domain